MKTIKVMGSAVLGSLSLALISPTVSYADVEQAAGAGSHSLVHRVSHSLAGADSYTSDPGAGYKWGRKAQSTSSEIQWAEESQTRGGYKWGNSEGHVGAESPAYAGAASYEWGTMSFPEQAAYKWGLRSYADQAAYKWGLRSHASQTAYKWGLR